MSQFFKFDHVYGLSKIVTEIKSKPWVDHVDMPPAETREKRLYQVMFANLLLADLKSGETTFSRFLSDLIDSLDEPITKSPFEIVARVHIEGREIDRAFLKELDKTLQIEVKPSLFEILVRGASRMKLPKRTSAGMIPHPAWRKRLVRLIAQETSGKSKTEIANRVKAQINSLTKRPTVTSVHVIEKLLKGSLVK